MTASPPIPAGFDPTDPSVMAERVPHEELLALRQNAPVFWVEQREDALAGFPGHDGYWAITKHADVAEISKNSQDFSTHENTAVIRYAPVLTREELEMQQVILLNTDAPDHTKMRQIVSRGFTPRQINKLHDGLKERTTKIVAEALAKGSGDFVSDVAAELPLQAIADLLGVPQEDRHKLFEWSNQMLSYDDPDIEGDEQVAAMEILNYSMDMAEDRIANPRDDIVTKLVTADVDGHGALTEDEFGFFVILLAVAGNETTRNAITWGMHAFMENPDQWELYRKERPATAIDEIIRWATPITVFQRTAINDVEVGGQLIKKGQRVGLFYASANFDEEVFEDPFTFNILRDPNPHEAFGGHGAHYCIGANLARLECKLMFDELADKMPHPQLLGDPVRFRSSWINGVKEMRVKYA